MRLFPLRRHDMSMSSALGCVCKFNLNVWQLQSPYTMGTRATLGQTARCNCCARLPHMIYEHAHQERLHSLQFSARLLDPIFIVYRSSIHGVRTVIQPIVNYRTMLPARDCATRPTCSGRPAVGPSTICTQSHGTRVVPHQRRRVLANAGLLDSLKPLTSAGKVISMSHA